MIVPMSKVYVVTQSTKQDRLLNALEQLGVIHVEPVEPEKAVAEEILVHAISALGHALQILQGLEPSGETHDLHPLEAAREAISIHKKIADEQDRLSALHRLADQLRIWGNTELAQLEHLRSVGIEIKFFSVAHKDLAGLEAECIETVAEQPGREAVIAIVDRTGQFQPPEGARTIPWPSSDLPAVKKEAAQVDASLKRHRERLAALEPHRIYPGHGPVIERPVELIREYIAHRMLRERQVLACLADGITEVDAMVARIYGTLVPLIFRAARQTIEAHLEKITEDEKPIG